MSGSPQRRAVVALGDGANAETDRGRQRVSACVSDGGSVVGWRLSLAGGRGEGSGARLGRVWYGLVWFARGSERERERKCRAIFLPGVGWRGPTLAVFVNPAARSREMRIAGHSPPPAAPRARQPRRPLPGRRGARHGGQTASPPAAAARDERGSGRARGNAVGRVCAVELDAAERFRLRRRDTKQGETCVRVVSCASALCLALVLAAVLFFLSCPSLAPTSRPLSFSLSRSCPSLSLLLHIISRALPRLPPVPPRYPHSLRVPPKSKPRARPQPPRLSSDLSLALLAAPRSTHAPFSFGPRRFICSLSRACGILISISTPRPRPRPPPSTPLLHRLHDATNLLVVALGVADTQRRGRAQDAVARRRRALDGRRLHTVALCAPAWRSRASQGHSR